MMNADVTTHSARGESASAQITPVQQTAAKVVGALYLIQMALAIFGEVVVRGPLIVRDAAQTAANIRDAEILFRLSLVGDLLIYASLVVLIWGSYIILKPINKDVALLASFFRLVEQAILSVTTFAGFIALRLLGDADYLRAIDSAQLHALARAFVGMYGIGLSIGFVFLGLGSAVFSYVWLQSGYIPRAIAYLGIFASLLLTVMTMVTMIFPVVWERIGMAYMMPMGLFEVSLGFWLLIKGLRTPSASTQHAK